MTSVPEADIKKWEGGKIGGTRVARSATIKAKMYLKEYFNLNASRSVAIKLVPRDSFDSKKEPMVRKAETVDREDFEARPGKRLHRGSAVGPRTFGQGTRVSAYCCA